MSRVVITGTACCTPLGATLTETVDAIGRGDSGVVELDEWREYRGLSSVLAAPIRSWTTPPQFTRKVTRTMGRDSQLAVSVAQSALGQAKLLNTKELVDGRAGVAFGSCLGGPESLMGLAERCGQKDFLGLSASSFLKMMSHACSANISLYFNLAGRQIPTCSACTSATQAIGLSYETIKAGHQSLMIAGGAEELCVGLAALFNSMGALSKRTDGAPRPFSKDRDGIVIGEGAGALVLEDLDHAKARGAAILAEVVSFAMNSDGSHMTNPDSNRMRRVMELALEGTPSARSVGLIQAHATGTSLGDAAEARAIRELFGSKVPVTAHKSYLGHTLGGGGAIEACLALEYLSSKRIAPIRNFTGASDDCVGIDLITETREVESLSLVMVNTFAFGGVNTCVILGEYRE